MSARRSFVVTVESDEPVDVLAKEIFISLDSLINTDDPVRAILGTQITVRPYGRGRTFGPFAAPSDPQEQP